MKRSGFHNLATSSLFLTKSQYPDTDSQFDQSHYQNYGPFRDLTLAIQSLFLFPVRPAITRCSHTFFFLKICLLLFLRQFPFKCALHRNSNATSQLIHLNTASSPPLCLQPTTQISSCCLSHSHYPLLPPPQPPDPPELLIPLSASSPAATVSATQRSLQSTTPPSTFTSALGPALSIFTSVLQQ